MLTNQRPHADRSAAEAADSAVRDATTVRAEVARGGSKRLLKILLPIVLGGGFFVLFAILALTEHVPLLAVPNDALATVAIPANSPVVGALVKTIPALSSLESLASYDTALVVLSSPLAVGIIAYAPQQEDPPALSKTNPSYAPIGNHLIVVGNQSFINRVIHAQKLPWWIRLRATLISKNHDAALLVASTPETPWLLGAMDKKNGALEVLLRLPTDPQETSRAVESTIQTTLFNLVRAFLPVSSSMRLPDNSIAQELRENKDALSWKIEEKSGPTYTLLQNNKPVLFYGRLKEKNECSDKSVSWEVTVGTHPPLPELKLGISLLKQAVLFCVSNGDKL